MGMILHVYSITISEEEELMYMLLPAYMEDHLCQLWQ